MRKSVIAIFEDDKVNRFIYKKIFEQMEDKIEGYVFETPEKGFAVAKEVEFDVVFIEIHYRGENFGGIPILEELKKVSSREMIAIATTSLLQDGDLEKIIPSGFTMCMEKPMAFQKLFH
ncbi:MAG: response regulator [Bacteroidota bacterium]